MALVPFHAADRSEVIAGAFTDHLHHERRERVGLDVAYLQNLFAVLLRHRSHLCEAGYHFGVQQAAMQEKDKRSTENVSHRFELGMRLGISLTVFLGPFACSQSMFLVSAPGFHEPCQSRCAPERLDGLAKQIKTHLF